ncbi:MAG: large protein [Chitinophagaceae bacterium]|nr:large protein [Chitinophagaceae bacterium]
MNQRVRIFQALVLKSLLLGLTISFILAGQKANAQCFPAASGVSVSYTIHPPTCNGGTNGSVDVIVTGGGAPYTFTIAGSTISFQSVSQATNTYTFTNLPADPSFFISIQAKIASGFAVCNFSSLTMSEPAPITVTSAVTNVSCNLGSNGAITLSSVSGGTGPYSFLWSNGAITQNISGLTAGAYSLTITDANGCPQNFNFTVNQPLPITITSSITNVSCNGGSNGAIMLSTVSGGTGPYTFLWSTGAVSQNVAGLTAGPYSVTITDANGCPQAFNFTVTQPIVISATSSITNVSCNGGNNGAITLSSVSGGTGPYTFLWSNGASSQNISGLTAGPYSVTVTDANGCPKVLNFTVTQPTAIAVTSSITNVSCNGGNNGAITLSSVSGGTGPYTFLLSNGASSQNISGLTAGPYSVTVTDANGCPQVFNFTITQSPAIAVTSSITNVSCNGGNNGAITLSSVSGGTGPYTFLWNTGAVSQNISGLTAGPYSVTVTDANGCPKVFNFTVTQPTVIAVTSSITNVSCNGGNNGAITLSSVSGGTGPYTFLWNTGAVSQNLAGLTAGPYSVTVKDANGCPKVFNFTVTQPATIAITSSITNISCNGGNNGAITLNTVSGGTAPYSFAWSNGAISQNVSGLSVGVYSVTITDANACPGQVFNFTITQPTVIASTSSITNVSCNGGSNGAITLTTVSGGTAPYTFLWSNGAVSQNVAGLTAGLYSVTVTDANGCPQVFNFTITQPTAIAVTSSITNVSCNGGNNGAITLSSVSGGTGPYTFLWSTGAVSQNIGGLTVGAYSVTITDANGCPKVFNFTVTQPTVIAVTSSVTNISCNGGNNGAITLSTVSGGTGPYTFLWSTGAVSQNIAGLTIGAYSVTITDANGCPKVFNFNVTQPAPISVTSSITNVSCNGGNNGAITLTSVSGGTAPYTFLWSNGAVSQNVSGLIAGAYSVTITDTDGCPQVLNFTITQPTAITATSSITNASCNGGSNGAITLTTVSGGTGPYTFLWSNGAVSQNVSGLIAGAYSVTITDANGCPKVFNFTITEPTAIAVTSSITNVSCNGGNNGTITLSSVSGGTGPYTFLWSTGAISQNVSGLTAGLYSVTVTDANGCPKVFNFTVTQPAPITITSSITNVSCNGGSNGAITLTTISGGTAPYTFLWSTGALSQNISGLIAGAYSVTITDASGCPGQLFNFTVTQSASIAVTSSFTNVTCNGGNNGTITLAAVSGGTAPYTFLWSNGAVSQNVSGLIAGVYSVTVTDANACFQIFNFTISEPAPIAITSSITDASCNGGNNGVITLSSVSGGTGPYTFLWNTGATTQNVNGLSAGAYSVTITDANSCLQVFNFNVNQPTPIVITSSITNTSCNGGNNGSITLSSVSGGTGPYTFLWSTGAISQNVSGLTAGAYSVTVTDANGCPQVFNFNVAEPAPISIVSSTTNATTCGGNDGTITLTSIAGGTAPYTFLWNTGATAQNISGLVAGAYSVSITDANGCPQIFNFSISDPTPFTVVATSTDITCNGANNGSITNTVTGGTAPFTVLWNTGANTLNLSGLSAGPYTVTITDASNCTYNGNYTINEPAVISITSSSVDVSTCGGNDGSITINTVSGGIPGYTFLWSNGATTQNISGLSAGSYSLTITDNNGCISIYNFPISDPVPFTVSAVVTDVTCNGANNGSIVHTITGGTAPFTILWNTGATTPNLNGIAGGNYTVKITDASNCSYNGSYTVNEPAAINITSSISNATTCGGSDGAIDLLTISGGTAPYTFLWNTGASSQNIAGLIAGPYSVTISDASGCTPVVFNFTISDPVPYTVTDVISNVTCNGSANGSINLTIAGGAAPFTILWSNGASTQNITGLLAGTYTVDITDAGGCSFSGSYIVTELNAIAATSSTVDVSCNGGNNGAINLLSVSGGTGSYSFLWNTGAITQNISGLAAGNYTVTITDTNGCPQTFNFTINEPAPLTANATVTNPSTCGGNDGSVVINSVSGGLAPYSFSWSTGAVTQNINTLVAGNYTVTVTDANSCSQSFTYAISDPTPFTVTPTLTQVSCNGASTGAINLTLAGGTAPFTILWNNGAVTQNISGLIAGAYSVSIKDAGGCTFNANYTITEPLAIAVVSSVSNTSNCSSTDGSITLSSVSGGTPAYTFAWSNGASTQNISALASGVYSVVITDASSCSNTFNFAISNPASFTVTPTITNLTCGGANTGSISLTIGGSALPPVNILWNTGATTNTINGLAAGSYTVNVSDASGCSYNGSYTISQPIPVDTASIVDNKTPTLCYGSNEGSIVLTNVTGGVSPYTYILNGISSPVPSFDTLVGGNYTMTIVDASGCSYYHSFTIFQPAQISYTVSTTPSVCFNNDGTLTFSPVTGGTPSYLYSIDSGLTYSSAITYDSLSPGNYPVFVKDTNSCTYGYIVPIILKQGPIPYVRVVPPTCNGGDNGAIILDSISGGVTPFDFYLNGQDRGSSKVYTDLIAGNYTLIIQDQDCAYSIQAYLLYDQVTHVYDTLNATPSITVTQPAAVTASTLTVDTYNHQSTGMAVVYNFTGGTSPYQYSLDTTQGYTSLTDTLVYLSGLDRGDYNVFLLDTNGCQGEVTVHVKVGFFIPNLITPNGDGQNDYFQVMALPLHSTLAIYNSWNDRIYYDTNYNNAWEAKGLSDGVYYYELSLPSGKNYKGWLQVLR